jgi:hypothetical protein
VRRLAATLFVFFFVCHSLTSVPSCVLLSRPVLLGWIFALGHRPLYCSNVDTITDCTVDATKLREGINGQWGWEEAFATRPLDAYFGAHEHSYERTYPVFKGVTDTASLQDGGTVYENPKNPCYITTGSGGNRELLEWFDQVFYGQRTLGSAAEYRKC